MEDLDGPNEPIGPSKTKKRERGKRNTFYKTNFSSKMRRWLLVTVKMKARGKPKGGKKKKEGEDVLS